MKKIFLTSSFWLTCIAASALDNASTAITKFEVSGQVGATVIDTLAGSIFLSVPEGTNVKMLTPVVETKGRSVSLLWNKGNDVQCPHIYASVAHNGNIREYRVSYSFVAVPQPKSSECNIRSFKIGSNNGVIQGDTVRVRNLPADTDIGALSPEILISDKATISPNSGVAQDFRNPVAYTVTAEDGVSQRRYTAVVTKKVDANTGAENVLVGQLTAYPNPFTHSICIESGDDDVAKVDVFDSGGALRLSVKNVSSKRVNFAALPGGAYFMRVTLGNGASKVIQVIKK
jgi:hypothetical protein